MSSGRPLDVHHFIAPGRYGGAESVVAALCRGLADRGHRVRVSPVLSGDPGGHPLVDALRSAGVRVVPVVVGERAYRSEWSTARRLLTDDPPRVVHTHGHRPDLLEGTLARILGIPVVTTVHGFTGVDWKTRLYRRVQHAAFRGFDAVVAVSGPLARELAGAGVPGNRIHEIPNSRVDGTPPLGRSEARARLGVPGEVFHVGWVGRLSREKGPDLFVRALADFAGIPLVASIVGAGPMVRELRALAGRLGLDGRVRWQGELPDAWRLFPAFDAFVLSSRSEGAPVVLLEAIEAGVPVVATRVGGIPELVSPSEALLVPPERPDLLAGALLDVHSTRGAAADRARRALERLRRERSPERWIDRYERAYRDAIGRREGERREAPRRARAPSPTPH